MAQDPRLKLSIIRSADPQSVRTPALVEFEIGQNGQPESKDRDFVFIVDKGMGAGGGIAMYKYCYVDVDASTDVERMFSHYQGTINAAKAKYPALKIVHITMPLTISESNAKAWAKRLLGRGTAQELNVKRNQFNQRLRSAYGGVDPIFDLAEVESTNSDGSRSYFTRSNEKFYTLSPELTEDGGHLNERGRRAAAQEMLRVLAAVQ